VKLPRRLKEHWTYPVETVGVSIVSNGAQPEKTKTTSKDSAPQATPDRSAPPPEAPERRRVPWKAILVAAALVICGVAFYAWHVHQRHQRDRLLLYGNVDIREVNLGFRVGGKIAQVLKDEGDAVKEGEFIARLDPEPYEREVDDAKARLESARTTLANNERTFVRKKDLLGQKVLAQQEVDDASAARDAARAEVDRAEAGLASAKLHLADTELKAPSNGVVMTRVFEPGAILQTGATLFTISLSDVVWVRAYVSEDRLGNVHQGMTVFVFTDSAPDKPYQGQIGLHLAASGVHSEECRDARAAQLAGLSPARRDFKSR